MEVIQATLNELDILTKLFDEYRQFYRQDSAIDEAKEFLYERIINNQSIIFLAIDKEQNKGAGFTQLYPSFSSVSMKRIFILNDLYVNPGFRRNNIAKMLMNQAKQYATEQKAIRLTLQTEIINASAQNLYESTGWIQDKEHFYYDLAI